MSPLKSGPPLKSGLLAASILLSFTGMAMAQSGPAPAGTSRSGSVYDPAQLPVVKGTVAQYTLTPRGDVDGFILQDGTEVHVNPGLSTELVFAIHPGDAVTIHGLKARAIPMVAGVSVTNDKTGAVVTGPMGRPGMRRDYPLSDAGTVKAVLHTPRGEANGVLLQDGAVVRLPPPEARRLAGELAVGQSLAVKGEGIKSPLGEVIMARSIGPDSAHMTEIHAPHPRGMLGMMGRWMHGPRPGGPGHDHMPPPPAPDGNPAPTK